ncbi:MAG TPA: hypothetical protein VGB02_10465 [Pyrinomonadaceae bacterium]|jgi:hypothetical protein
MKNVGKTTIFAKRNTILILSLICAIFTVSLIAQMNTKSLLAVSTQQQNRQNQNKQIDFINEAAKPLSAQENKARKEKNRRYDKKIKFKPNRKLTELPDGTGSLGPKSESPRLPSLPIVESDVIAFGTVTEMQPFMTESEYLIYTEFTFQVEGVLKGTESENISEGSKITIDQEAGAISLANGKAVFYNGSGAVSSPRTKKRYLLFLKRINDGYDLSIIGGYELLNGKVFPLETITVFSPSESKTKKIMPFAAKDESVFLQIVRDAIANPNNIPNGGEN